VVERCQLVRPPRPRVGHLAVQLPYFGAKRSACTCAVTRKAVFSARKLPFQIVHETIVNHVAEQGGDVTGIIPPVGVTRPVTIGVANQKPCLKQHTIKLELLDQDRTDWKGKVPVGFNRDGFPIRHRHPAPLAGGIGPKGCGHLKRNQRRPRLVNVHRIKTPGIGDCLRERIVRRIRGTRRRDACRIRNTFINTKGHLGNRCAARASRAAGRRCAAASTASAAPARIPGRTTRGRTSLTAPRRHAGHAGHAALTRVPALIIGIAIGRTAGDSESQTDKAQPVRRDSHAESKFSRLWWGKQAAVTR